MFFCTLPDCYFKIEAPLTLGKEAICNLCNEPFFMNEYSIKLTRPHCNNCGKRKVNVDGKNMYIDKRMPAPLVAVAEGEINSLRDRLNSLTGEDDI